MFIFLIVIWFLHMYHPLNPMEFSTEFNNKIQSLNQQFHCHFQRTFFSISALAGYISKNAISRCLFSIFYINISYDVLFSGIIWIMPALNLSMVLFNGSVIVSEIAACSSFYLILLLYKSNAFSLFLSGFCCFHKSWRWVYKAFHLLFGSRKWREKSLVTNKKTRMNVCVIKYMSVHRIQNATKRWKA